MAAIRSKNTKPELLVRSLVYGMGYRYRLHNRSLPGSPDLALPKHRKAIFVHGCFWHAHEAPDCPLSHAPQSNATFWSAKFERNRKRDLVNLTKLAEAGWDVLTVWECETKDERRLARRLQQFLRQKQVSRVQRK